MLTRKKWTIFSLLVLCGGTIYKLPSLKDAFYVPMQEYFHLTNGQIGNAMSVNRPSRAAVRPGPIACRAALRCHSH